MLLPCRESSGLFCSCNSCKGLSGQKCNATFNLDGGEAVVKICSHGVAGVCMGEILFTVKTDLCPFQGLAHLFSPSQEADRGSRTT